MEINREPAGELAPVPQIRYLQSASTGYQEIPPPPATYTQDAGEAYEGGLFEYWRILRRHKGAVILFSCLGLLLGILITLPQTPIYQAHALLEIQDINPDYMNLHSQDGGAEEGSITNALADIQTQIKILQSETLVGQTLSKLKPSAPSSIESAAGRITAWRKALGLPVVDKPTPDQELKAALSNLKARASGQTRIVEVTYDSPDPQRAADFVNNLTNFYIQQNVEARWNMMQRTGDWLTRQLDDVRVKLERSEDALQNYAQRTGLMFTGTGDKQDNVSEEKLRQVQTALSDAQADRVKKQSRYEMAKNSPPDALPDVLNDVSLRDYQTKLTELRRQEAELEATYKPGYEKVKRVNAQIQPLQAAVEQERQDILDRIRNEYEEALRREKLLEADYAAQAKLVTDDAEKSIQYNILKREVDTNQQIYQAMLERVKESSITSAMRASNVRIVDSAKPPVKPYKPSVTLNAGLGWLGGLFLGIAFVVMRERADRTLQEPGDATYYLAVPELGIIPEASAVSKKSLGYFRREGKDSSAPEDDSLSPASPVQPLSLTGNSSSADAKPSRERIELVTWQRKPSMVAESFRVVLTSLLFSGDNGSRPRLLVMTSSGPSEGKTTVVSNLGIALAEIKQRTLLIDADLRRPRLHKIFDLPNDRGLSDLLQERPLPPGALEGIVQETSIPRLFVVTSGPASMAAANLLYSGNLPELLSYWKKEYDMVLVDTPPMLQMPDARVVARSVDGVVIVARAGHTTRDAALAARQRFTEDNTRVLGTILNGWNPKNSPNGYYGYYSGYYNRYSKYYTPQEG